MRKLILALFIVLGSVFATQAQDVIKFKVDQYSLYVDGQVREQGYIEEGIITITPDRAVFKIPELDVDRTVNLASSESTHDGGVSHISFLASDEDIIVMFSITDDRQNIAVTYITATFYVIFRVANHSLNYRGI